MKTSNYISKNSTSNADTNSGGSGFLWTVLLILIGLTLAKSIHGQVQVPFQLRHYSEEAKNGIYTLKGDFVMLANTNILGVSTGDNGSNTNFDFQFVDIDNDLNTFNSSKARLELPARVATLPNCTGHEVSIVYAGLYWTGKGNLRVNKTQPSTQLRQHIFVNLPSSSTYWYRTTQPADTTNYRRFFTNSSLTTQFGWVYLATPNGNPLMSATDAPPASDLTKFSGNGSGNTYYYRSTDPVWMQDGTSWTDAEKGTVLIKKDGASVYDTVRATSPTNNRWVMGAANKYKYVCYQDITSYIQSKGLGDYVVANIKTQEGASDGDIGNFGGWGIIVVYQHPDEKMRNIAIFDGYADLAPNGTSAYAFALDGFKSVLSGPVNVKLGVLAGEGDAVITHDWLNIILKDKITTAKPISYWVANPNTSSGTTDWFFIPNPDDATSGSYDNYFRSTISTGGNYRYPNVKYNYGIDAHTYYLNNTDKSLIGNGQTQTVFSYRGNTDELVMFMLGMSVDAYTPEPIGYIKDIIPANLHNVNPGDTILYNLEISNRGSESVDSLIIKLPIPYNATIIPGSLSFTNNLPTGSCYDNKLSVIYQNDALNQILIQMTHLPGPNDTIGTCLVPKPWDPNKIWATISFKLRATDLCVYLDNECAHNINLIGSVSGKGSITGTLFNNTTIKGWTEESGNCTRTPIYGANVVTINNGQCKGDPFVTKEFCIGTTVISLDDIKTSIPKGVYDFYTSNASWEKIGTSPLTSFPGAGYYLAFPINNYNPDCNSPIKIKIVIPTYVYLDTIYVKLGGCSNGRDWSHPMGDLQKAMKYARKAVWVSASTYNSNIYSNDGYTLKDSIKIYGGFNQYAADGVDNSISKRNILANQTILTQTVTSLPIVSSPTTVNIGTTLNGFFIQGSTSKSAIELKDKISVEYCVIQNNSSGANPTIKFTNGGSVINSLITGNNSTGGIMNFNGGGSMHLSTLVSNTGTGVNGASGTISNSIIWGNTVAQTSGTHTITYSAVQSLNGTTYGLTTNNNIALDPVNLNTWGPNFGNAPATSTDPFSNYWLNFFSKLKAAGNNSTVTSLGLTADLKRSHRIKGENVDMGAFESRYLLTQPGNITWSGNTALTTWPATATQGNPETNDFVFLSQKTHAQLSANTTVDGLVFMEGKDNLINGNSTSGNNVGVASMYTNNFNLTVASDIYYSKRFAPNKWHFLYVPYDVSRSTGVLDSLLNPLPFNTTGGYSVKYYDGIQRSSIGSNASGVAGKNWKYITTNTLSKQKGYNFAVLQDRLVYFKAKDTLNNRSFLGGADFQLKLDFAPLVTGNGAYDGDQGWNLFGIPYASFFRPKTNISLPTNWYETKSALFNVVFWNSDASGGDKYVPVVTTVEDKYFPPFSALFVEIPSAQTGSDYTLSAVGRKYGDISIVYTPSNVYQSRSASANYDPLLFAINVVKGDFSDRALVLLNPDASASFEVGRDMGKFGNSNAANPQLSMNIDGKPVCINELPPASGVTRIPLNLYIGENGTYKLNLENNPKIAQNGYNVTIEDTYLNTINDPTMGDYEFTSTAGTFNDRFVMNISKTATSTIKTQEGNFGWMFVKDDILTITGLEKGNIIYLFDVSGHLITSVVANKPSETITLSQKGVYLVKVSQTTGTVMNKVINE